jgi:arylsulfatase A-like enzyme
LVAEFAEGYPGYNGAIPFENGFLSEILLGHGYNTYALGKWQLTQVIKGWHRRQIIQQESDLTGLQPSAQPRTGLVPSILPATTPAGDQIAPFSQGTCRASDPPYQP